VVLVAAQAGGGDLGGVDLSTALDSGSVPPASIADPAESSAIAPEASTVFFVTDTPAASAADPAVTTPAPDDSGLLGGVIDPLPTETGASDTDVIASTSLPEAVGDPGASGDGDVAGPTPVVDPVDPGTTDAATPALDSGVSGDGGVAGPTPVVDPVDPGATDVATTTAEASPISSSSCDAVNGTIFSTSKGDFIIECGIDRYGMDLVIDNGVQSFEDCINTCAATDDCVDVSWNGNCYMKNGVGVPYASNDVWGARLLSAPTPAGPTEPAVASPISGPTCNADNGTIYSTSKGDFIIECGIDRYGMDYGIANGVQTYVDCINTCAAMAECVDISWNGNCYLKNGIGDPVQSTEVWGARLASPPTTPVSTTAPEAATTDVPVTIPLNSGGGDVATVVVTPVDSTGGPAATGVAPRPFAFQGCYGDVDTNALGGSPQTAPDGQTMNSTVCQTICDSADVVVSVPYAVIYDTNFCYCPTTLTATLTQTGCFTTCAGEQCGAPGIAVVFERIIDAVSTEF
jgi:hypothetical protein